MKCTEKIWVEDIGDGYAGNMACGGEMREVGLLNFGIDNFGEPKTPKTLYQCENCKTIQLKH